MSSLTVKDKNFWVWENYSENFLHSFTSAFQNQSPILPLKRKKVAPKRGVFSDSIFIIVRSYLLTYLLTYTDASSITDFIHI